MRALTHIHTTHSWDSRLGIGRLVDALVVHGVELALICDHNDFAGSLAVRELVRRRGLALLVPVAAEIRTDRGDVIVVFEAGDPPPVSALLHWDDLPRVVGECGGLIWLPHPYQSHNDVDVLAAGSDVIEVFNARCDREQNARATELCVRHGRVPAYGADVHRHTEIGRFTVEYRTAPTMLDTLRSVPSCPDPVGTRRSDVMAAEVVNGVKRGRPLLAGYNLMRWVRHRAREVVR